jgi:hypothetical protein
MVRDSNPLFGAALKTQKVKGAMMWLEPSIASRTTSPKQLVFTFANFPKTEAEVPALAELANVFHFQTALAGEAHAVDGGNGSSRE